MANSKQPRKGDVAPSKSRSIVPSADEFDYEDDDEPTSYDMGNKDDTDDYDDFDVDAYNAAEDARYNEETAKIREGILRRAAYGPSGTPPDRAGHPGRTPSIDSRTKMVYRGDEGVPAIIDEETGLPIVHQAATSPDKPILQAPPGYRNLTALDPEEFDVQTPRVHALAQKFKNNTVYFDK